MKNLWIVTAFLLTLCIQSAFAEESEEVTSDVNYYEICYVLENFDDLDIATRLSVQGMALDLPYSQKITLYNEYKINGFLPAVGNAVVPGLGSLIAGNYGDAIVIAAGITTSFVLTLATWEDTFIFPAFGFYGYGLVAPFFRANRHNKTLRETLGYNSYNPYYGYSTTEFYAEVPVFSFQF